VAWSFIPFCRKKEKELENHANAIKSEVDSILLV